MAAYELSNMGFDNLKVLKGGFNQWKRSERYARLTVLKCTEELSQTSMHWWDAS